MKSGTTRNRQSRLTTLDVHLFNLMMSISKVLSGPQHLVATTDRRSVRQKPPNLGKVSGEIEP